MSQETTQKDAQTRITARLFFAHRPKDAFVKIKWQQKSSFISGALYNRNHMISNKPV
jgi:hypothetical protein